MINPLIALLRKKAFAKAYTAARENRKLVNATDDEAGESPFQWACRFGDKATVLEFLKLGADLKQRDAEGEVPLELVADGSPYATAAQVSNRTEMAKALLAAKCPLGPAVLAKACSLGAGKATQLVEMLIAAEAKGDFVDDLGATILHVACEYDLPAALDYGLKLGVDVNAVLPASNYDAGSTALHIAVKKRRPALITKLIAAGARTDIKNKKKQTPLDLATRELRKILDGQPAKAAPPKRTAKQGSTKLAAQLWDAPRDPDILRVYADWLIEQGETSRGEYIGLALVAKPTAAQTKRKAQLLAKDRGRWLGDARKLVSAWIDSETTPGFVASATVSVDNVIAHLDELAALGPELTLRVTPIKTRLLTKKLATLPLGKKLHGMHFYNTRGTYGMNRDWVDDTSMAILGPALVGLRALVLAPAIQANEREGFTPAAFASLAPAGKTLTALTLDLSESSPTRELLDAVTPKLFPALTALTFVGLDKTLFKHVRSVWAKSGAAVSST